MSTVALIYFFVGSLVTLFLGLFSVTSIREHKPRATIVSGVSGIGFAALWIALYYLVPTTNLLLIPVGLMALFKLLFFLPSGSSHPLEVVGQNERVDERDTIFAREEYVAGDQKYQQYYARRPELQQADDRLRRQPELLAPGGRYYDQLQSEYTAGLFRFIAGLTDRVDGSVADPAPNLNAAQREPQAMTARIKQLAEHLGAAEVGIARVDPAWVYSHVGRGPEPYGQPIAEWGRFAIVFSLPMAYERVEMAPLPAITEETGRRYLQGTVIAIALAEHIRGLGYPARAQVAGSNYQVMLPPLAVAAGLGELGRFGYLISRRLGSRIRLGAVLTDLPLVPAEPVSFGVVDFCRQCRRCAESCPSGSIPKQGRSLVRGVRKWPLEVESCLHYWRHIGTDCGICMKVCPYSHPRSFVHQVVRWAIVRSRFARWIAVRGEDLFYGAG